MSQHQFHTHIDGKPVVVQMGFDRPLGHFHMIVYEVGQMDDPIYTNLDQQDGFDLTLDDYRAALSDLGIVVPESMFAQTELDAQQRRGNRAVTHHQDGTFTEIQG